MPNTYTQPFLGQTMVKWISGTAGATTGEKDLGVIRVTPMNPDNITYPAVVNATSYPSMAVPGKKTPTISMSAPYKASWCSALLFNGLIVNVGTDNLTNKYAIGVKDDRASSLRTWDWSRCSRLEFSQTAGGGPVMVSMDFMSRWGDGEMPNAAVLYDGETTPATTTFAGPTTDAGQVLDTSLCSVTGLTNVRSWTLTLLRGQVHNGYVDKTLYCKDIVSTMFSGVFSCDQDLNGTQISSTGTVTLNLGPAATAGYITAALSVKRDDHVYPEDVGLGNITSRYSLIDLSAGGNPCTIAAS